MSNSIKDFLKAVRLAFPVFHKSEKRFYRDFESSINAYAEQFPSCSVEDLTEHFGEPKDIVITYFNNMESSVYFSVMKRVRYLKVMMVSGIIFLLILLIMSFGFLWHAKNTYKNNTIYDYDVDITIEYINDEEMP